MAGPFMPLASPIISAAATQVQKRLDEAKAKNRNEVERLVAYLRAVSEAVKGLEAEADELLSQCRWADWADEKWRQEFLKRCSSYLEVDRLRVQLSEALNGLDASRLVLRKRADALVQRSVNKVQRQAVMLAVQEIVGEFHGYLHSLGLTSEQRASYGESAAPGSADVLISVRLEISKVWTSEEAQAAKERNLPEIRRSHNPRMGYEAVGALEALVVRIEDAFL
jgi:hypothetical protein